MLCVPPLLFFSIEEVARPKGWPPGIEGIHVHSKPVVSPHELGNEVVVRSSSCQMAMQIVQQRHQQAAKRFINDFREAKPPDVL